MSWQIPTEIEKDFKSGKAQYRTFQTGVGGQSILPVPSNSYVVIFGYDFSPAGGGVTSTRVIDQNAGPTLELTDNQLRAFETQQISFYTGSDFYPFIHHIDAKTTFFPYNIDASNPLQELVTRSVRVCEINNSPLSRQVYITSSNDVTITHGLIINGTVITLNAIPITNRTPLAITYGGSAQLNATQTNFGPAGTPQQFMQPSTKDYQDFAFGLLPSNADGQAFATPDAANGLVSATDYLNGFGPTILDAASAQYYLCLHYAIYTETIPEQRG